MGNKKKNQKLIITMLILVISAVIISMIVLSINPNAFANGTLDFKIPVPTELQSVITVEDIDCRYRTTVYVIDSTGQTIDTTSGNSQFGNPIFQQSVIDLDSGKQTAGYVVIPKIGCNAQAPIVIDASQMWVTWEAKGQNGLYQEIAQTKFTTAKLNLPAYFGVGVKSAGQSSIVTTTFKNQIEDVLGTDSITSDLRVKVFGVFTIYWDGYENIKYYWQIDKEKSTVSNILFKIVNPNDVEDEDTKDTDNDGIIDKYDQCDTKDETYNGFEDGDGCPDSVPSSCSTDEDYIDGQCVPKNSNEGNGGEEPNPIDSDEECNLQFSKGDLIYIWDEENQECVPDEEESSGNGGTNNALIKNAYILVEPKYLDGTQQAFTLPLEGQAPITINFGNILASFDGANKKALADLETSVFIDVGTSSWSVKSHTVTAKPSIRVSGTTIPTCEGGVTANCFSEVLYTGYSTSSANTVSLPKSTSGGQITFTGLSLGKSSLLMSKLTEKIPSDLVPLGQVRDLDITIDITGDVTLKADAGGEVTGKLEDGLLRWSMEIGKPTKAQQQNCPEGQNAVTVDGQVVCVPFGETPTTTECKIGQDACEICRDDDNVGGFPCTKDYRESYCGSPFGFDSTTMCIIPPSGDTENPKYEKTDSECSAGSYCIQTSVDPTKNDTPSGVTGGFSSNQQGSNPFAGVGGDLNQMALIIGVFGIIAGIGIIVLKMRKH